MTGPMVAWLETELRHVKELARAAGCVEIEAVDYLWEAKYLNLRHPDGTVKQTTEFSAELADHIAVHSPAAVLRRVVADRQILAEHEPTPEDSSGRYCSTCSQTEEQPQPIGWWVPWPCRTVLLLAEGYGWTGEAQ